MSLLLKNTWIFCFAIFDVFYGYKVATAPSGITKGDLKRYKDKSLFLVTLCKHTFENENTSQNRFSGNERKNVKLENTFEEITQNAKQGKQDTENINQLLREGDIRKIRLNASLVILKGKKQSNWAADDV